MCCSREKEQKSGRMQSLVVLQLGQVATTAEAHPLLRSKSCVHSHSGCSSKSFRRCSSGLHPFLMQPMCRFRYSSAIPCCAVGKHWSCLRPCLQAGTCQRASLRYTGKDLTCFSNSWADGTQQSRGNEAGVLLCADRAASAEGPKVSTGHWRGPLPHRHRAECCCHAHSQPWRVSLAAH